MREIIYALSVIMTIFTPIYPLLWMIIIICVIDLIMAIWVDINKHGDRKIWRKFRIIKSNKLRKTTTKIFLYLILTMLLYLIPLLCFGNSLYIVNAGAFSIFVNELWSIGEKMGFITGSNIFVKIIRSSVKKMNEWLNNTIGQQK